MIQLRPSGSRGFADHGWLVARHSFSFADYYDPDEMGWGALRVINLKTAVTRFRQHVFREADARLTEQFRRVHA